MNRSVWVIFSICFCVVIGARQQKFKKFTETDSVSIFKNFLPRAECTMPSANDWLKAKLQQALQGGLEEMQLSQKLIEFPESLLLKGTIDLTNLKLSVPQNTITIKTATMDFQTSETIVTTNFDDIEVTVTGKYAADLKLFGDTDVKPQGDLEAKFQFKEWSHKFPLKYHFYPLQLKVENVESELKLSVDAVTLDELISEKCVSDVLNAEISTSLGNYIQDQEELFVDEINEEFETIIKQIINSLLPNPEPELPLPGPEAPGTKTDSIKGSLSQIVALKVNEEFENFLKDSNVTKKK